MVRQRSGRPRPPADPLPTSFFSSASFRVGLVLLVAAAVWALPGGGKAAAFVWDLLGAAMLAVIVIAALGFGREHSLDLERLGTRGRSLVYGTLGLLALAVVSRPSLWSTSVGSAIWLAMVGLVAGGGYMSWRLWRDL